MMSPVTCATMLFKVSYKLNVSVCLTCASDCLETISSLSLLTVLFFLLLFRIGCAESSTLNRLLSSRGDLGRPLFAVHRPLVASLVELGLEGVWASVVQ